MTRSEQPTVLARALDVAIEEIGNSFPEPLRSSFKRSCHKKISAHIGHDHGDLDGRRFAKAVGVLNVSIQDMHKHLEARM